MAVAIRNDQDLRFNLNYPQFLVPLTYHQLLIVSHYMETMVYPKLLIANILAEIIHQIWAIVISYFFLSENKHQKTFLYLIIPVIIFTICWGNFENIQLLILNISGVYFKYCLGHNFRSYSLFDYSGGYLLIWLGINLNKLWTIILLLTIFHYSWDYTSDSKSKYTPTIFNKSRDKYHFFIPQAQ